MNFCPACGAKLAVSNAKFCSQCGVELVHDSRPLEEWGTHLDLQSREGVDLFNRGLEAGRGGDHAEAALIFQKLAATGDREAMENLGYSLAQLGRDHEAFEWLQEAARGGFFRAASHLGSQAMEGGDSLSARRWFSISAEAGDSLDQALLAHLCIEARDYDCAKRWWTRLVAENNPEHQSLVDEARNNLAYMQEDPGYIAHLLEQRLENGPN